MDAYSEKISNIKESILKFVPAKYIYLFGSYAYGNPTEDSDIDIYVVTPDDVDNHSQLYAKIIGDLSLKKIFFIDLLLSRESVFKIRKIENILEETVFQKGKILYGQVRKPYEIICYHCAQSTEKYLKGFLSYNDIIPEKTHNLLLLLGLCIEDDNSFENIRTECSLLNRFTNEIRYPHKIEIKRRGGELFY
jgi:predicted nucleotidyltransferase